MRKSTKDIIRIVNEKQEARLLDVGCGTCKMTKLIVENCPNVQVEAIDPEDVSRYIPAGATFRQMSIYDLPATFSENYFDVIISQHVFEHLSDIPKAFEVLHRLVKKDGYIIIETPNWVRLFIPFHRNFFWNDYSHVRVFTKQAFYSLSKNYNMTPISIRSFSSITFRDGWDALRVSKNPLTFLKRSLTFFINPLLKDAVMLIAQKK